MSEEVDQSYAEEVLTTVIEWCMSCKPDWFDDGFVQSLYDQSVLGRKLSPRQVAALENIIDKFNIQ